VTTAPPPLLQAAVDKWVDAAAAVEEAAAAWLPPTGAAATEEVSELSTANQFMMHGHMPLHCRRHVVEGPPVAAGVINNTAQADPQTAAPLQCILLLSPAGVLLCRLVRQPRV
jgi:hypothetical protein